MNKISKRRWLTLLLGLFLPGLAAAAPATPPARSFAYVDENTVITAEVAGERSFVLNFINLSEFVLVIQPDEFIYRGGSGARYIGQVYESEREDAEGDAERYTASFLLMGHSYAGLTVIGAFRELDAIEEPSVRIGARRFYLEPLAKGDFEQLALQIGQLDLESVDPAAMLEKAGIRHMGHDERTDGTSAWDRDWEGLLTEDGINPPKIIERPEIPPTTEARKTKTWGTVKLSGVINRNGGIQGLEVVKGLGRGLDERALEGVRNSWVFLPATKNGEVVETMIGIEVEFREPEKERRPQAE
jgi:hypothetical protein